MMAYRDGDAIVAPRRAEGDDGLVGDAYIRLEPGTAEYDMWDAWLNQMEANGEPTTMPGTEEPPASTVIE